MGLRFKFTYKKKVQALSWVHFAPTHYYTFKLLFAPFYYDFFFEKGFLKSFLIILCFVLFLVIILVFLLCFGRFVICKLWFFSPLASTCVVTLVYALSYSHLCVFAFACMQMLLLVGCYSYLHLCEAHSELVVDPYLSLFQCCYFALVIAPVVTICFSKVLLTPLAIDASDYPLLFLACVSPDGIPSPLFTFCR